MGMDGLSADVAIPIVFHLLLPTVPVTASHGHFDWPRGFASPPFKHRKLITS